MKHRKLIRRCQNQSLDLALGQTEGIPDYCFCGIRCKDGVNLLQALIWNVRTCRPDVKGDSQVGRPHKR